jgi:zinc D-Ala-D-Ala carboxypeptidase
MKNYNRVWWQNIRYFTPEEFDSPDAPGLARDAMDATLVGKLNIAREIAGIPFKITSGYRTVTHNLKVGGRIYSAHLDGKAADIAAVSPHTRYKVLAAVLAAGFDRVEVGPKHIHVDVAADDIHPTQIVLYLDPRNNTTL